MFWNVSTSYKFLPGNPDVLHTFPLVAIEPYIKLFQKRKMQFEEYFKIGRSLIITSPVFHTYRFDPPESEPFQIDYFNCLGIEKPIVEKEAGTNIQAIEEAFVQNFYNQQHNKLHFDYKFPNIEGKPLMFIKDTKHVVAQYIKKDNGFIIFLPLFNFKNNPIPECEHFLLGVETFIKELHEFEAKSPLKIPQWANNYLLQGEKQELEKLDKFSAEKIKIDKSILKSEVSLSNYNFLKALFASSGSTLESVVEFVFNEFGFTVESVSRNRDDLIVKKDSDVAVVEIKGLTKSAAEKNAAQLQKWIGIYHYDSGKEPKGILVVNAYKDLEIDKRTKPSFPHQMQPYTKRMGHCLITGIQLLCMYLDFKNRELTQEEIRSMLFTTVGELIYKSDPMEIIKDQRI